MVKQIVEVGSFLSVQRRQFIVFHVDSFPLKLIIQPIPRWHLLVDGVLKRNGRNYRKDFMNMRKVTHIRIVTCPGVNFKDAWKMMQA